jgi:hypothetical protein
MVLIGKRKDGVENIMINLHDKALLRDRMTTDGFWIDDRIYWTL